MDFALLSWIVAFGGWRLHREGTGGTHTLTDKPNRNEAVVCVVGPGYVGLPLAPFSNEYRVTCHRLQITRYCPQGEVGMIKEFKEFGIGVSGFDPLLGKEAIEAFGIDAAEDLKGMGADCVVMAVSHDAFKDITLSALKGVMNSDLVLVDIRGMFCGADAERMGFCYRGL